MLGQKVAFPEGCYIQISAKRTPSEQQVQWSYSVDAAQGDFRTWLGISRLYMIIDSFLIPVH